MLRNLRFQLTFLYIMVALGLLALLGFGSYSLLKYFFQRETDLALQYKMATEMRAYGLIPPSELIQAEKEWEGGNPPKTTQSTTMLTVNELATVTPSQPQTPNTVSPTSIPTPTNVPIQISAPLPISSPTQIAVQEDQEEEEESEGQDNGIQPEQPGKTAVEKPGSPTQASVTKPELSENEVEEIYDGQLASIYVLPLDDKGQILNSTKISQPPFTQDEDASQAAITIGHDLRTITSVNGTRVRLLTYQISNPGGPTLLQLGRTLVDQDRVLKQYLMGLLILGSFSMVLLGLGSWYVAGRSMAPAQKAWDQQQSFVSNASHELRTPLTLIKASAEVGLRNQPIDEQRELWKDILTESDYMNLLVDDLLLLSRLDTHRLNLQYEPVSLPDLLQEISRLAEKLVGGKRITLEIRKAQGVIWADRARMRQVLLILIDNAIHYTPVGGTIFLETLSRRRTYQIIVSDNGSGIPPEHLPHLFERFYQANPTGEANDRSNGLGLSIAKGIIEAQGGKIHVDSTVGKGTRFTLELPAWSEGHK